MLSVQLQWDWFLLSPLAKQEEITRLKTTIQDVLDPYIRWQQLVVQFDHDYQSLLEDWTREGKLIGLLRQQNQILGELLVRPQPGTLAAKPLEIVELSAKGLGAFSVHAVSVGQDIKGSLLLLPLYDHVSFVGQVSTCCAEGEGFKIGITFEFLRSQEMEYLQRYLIKMEAQQRRLQGLKNAS